MGRKSREFCTRGHKYSKTRKFQANGDSYCSACKKIRYDTDRKKNPKKFASYSRRSKLRKWYGLEEAEFNEMLKVQEGRCKLCKTDVPGGRGWNIDHCHATGQVRGILCHACNTGIGLLKEDTELLQRAIEYLK